jgi:3-oxoacyl-[acyl-carrier-protein] synthase II
VGYVNAHGTGTPANDDLEARVLSELFPPETRVNSTKSLLGHTLGASGAIEALVTALTLRDGVAHPSRNLTDPEIPLAFVRAAEPVAARYALSESFAFGGQNAVLALARA